MSKDFSIYTAGPYSAKLASSRLHNIERAAHTGAQLMRQDWIPFIPHLSHYVAPYLPDELAQDLNFWLRQDFHWLNLCDAIYMLPNWENSKGATKEWEFANDKRIPIVYHAAEALELLRHFRGGK